jgi:hypothetical protein
MQEVTYLILSFCFMTQVTQCFFSHHALQLFMYMFLYFPLFGASQLLFLCASSNDLCIMHCISSCTRASSKDLCVAHYNSSWAHGLFQVTSVSLIVLPHGSRPLQVTFVSCMCNSSHALSSSMALCASHRTASVEQHQT